MVCSSQETSLRSCALSQLNCAIDLVLRFSVSPPLSVSALLLSSISSDRVKELERASALQWAFVYDDHFSEVLV